jgi:hypothetical protein
MENGGNGGGLGINRSRGHAGQVQERQQAKVREGQVGEGGCFRSNLAQAPYGPGCPLVPFIPLTPTSALLSPAYNYMPEAVYFAMERPVDIGIERGGASRRLWLWHCPAATSRWPPCRRDGRHTYSTDGQFPVAKKAGDATWAHCGTDICTRFSSGTF